MDGEGNSLIATDFPDGIPEAQRPIVGLAMNRNTLDEYVVREHFDRLEAIAEVRILESDRPSSWDGPPPPDPTDLAFQDFARQLDGLIVCHGSPRITETIFANSPRLRIVGELEGDRFAHRIDVDAAKLRGIWVVDTTHGSAIAVAEWALALAIIGLRKAPTFSTPAASIGPLDPGRQFQGESQVGTELTEKTVGLIGCGHIGRRLLDLLAPFRVSVLAFDPYAARELADAYGLTFTSLERVLELGRVVFCLAPLTPRTRGMLGERELALLQSGSVFVNVSRGPIVDSQALIDRLMRNDLIACLDVFDPEPVPPDSPIRGLSNAYLSPHIAGVTHETGPRFFELMVDEFERVLAGHEPRAAIDRRTIANRRGARQY